MTNLMFIVKYIDRNLLLYFNTIFMKFNYKSIFINFFQKTETEFIKNSKCSSDNFSSKRIIHNTIFKQKSYFTR